MNYLCANTFTIAVTNFIIIIVFGAWQYRYVIFSCCASASQKICQFWFSTIISCLNFFQSWYRLIRKGKFNQNRSQMVLNYWGYFVQYYFTLLNVLAESCECFMFVWYTWCHITVCDINARPLPVFQGPVQYQCHNTRPAGLVSILMEKLPVWLGPYDQTALTSGRWNWNVKRLRFEFLNLRIRTSIVMCAL